MKVLWFSPSPGLSDVHLNYKYMGIGWIKSLEKNIQDKIDLSIAFYFDTPVEPFTLGATKYFPIKRYRQGKLTKIKERLFNELESGDDVNTFLNIVEQVKPDLIHIHGTETPYGLIQKHSNIPTVVSIQGTITVYGYKYFSGVPYVDIFKYSSLYNVLLRRTSLHVYKRFIKMAEREQDVYNNTKHFIGRTAWDRRVTAILAPNANYYHNDEILRSSFYEQEWSEAKISPKFTLFTTNGPDIYKGLETLLDCARLLDAAQIDFEWHVAGLNESDEWVKIATKTTGKARSKNVKFLGTLNEQAIVKELLQAHIYVGVSHIENSPNSLCEAQILGMPCIATYAGGTSTLLEDGKDGILAQDGDPYVMAGAIIELKNNYTKAVEMGKNSKIKALLRHDTVKITKDLLAIYDKVLSATDK